MNRAALIADCEHVLRVHGTDVQELTAAPGKVVHTRPTVSQLVSRDESPKAQVDLSASAVPGGNLPVEEVDVPPLPPSLTTIPEPRSVGNGEPNLLPPPAQRTARDEVA